MTQTRFTCTLTRADEPACQSYARVIIIDPKGDSGRACPRRAAARPRRISRGRVDWSDSKSQPVGAHSPWSWPKSEASSANPQARTITHARQPV